MGIKKHSKVSRPVPDIMQSERFTLPLQSYLFSASRKHVLVWRQVNVSHFVLNPHRARILPSKCKINRWKSLAKWTTLRKTLVHIRSLELRQASTVRAAEWQCRFNINVVRFPWCPLENQFQTYQSRLTYATAESSVPHTLTRFVSPAPLIFPSTL